MVITQTTCDWHRPSCDFWPVQAWEPQQKSQPNRSDNNWLSCGLTLLEQVLQTTVLGNKSFLRFLELVILKGGLIQLLTRYPVISSNVRESIHLTPRSKAIRIISQKVQKAQLASRIIESWPKIIQSGLVLGSQKIQSLSDSWKHCRSGGSRNYFWSIDVSEEFDVWRFQTISQLHPTTVFTSQDVTVADHLFGFQKPQNSEPAIDQMQIGCSRPIAHKRTGTVRCCHFLMTFLNGRFPRGLQRAIVTSSSAYGPPDSQLESSCFLGSTDLKVLTIWSSPVKFRGAKPTSLTGSFCQRYPWPHKNNNHWIPDYKWI